MGKQYQPRWIKGRESGDRQRECAARYEAMKPVLARYTRPFSVFDLGANAGYFSFRIAEDFPHATVIAVDDKAALRECAEANGLRNVIVLPKRLDGAALAMLAACERFDVVLALNVLHHIEDWPRALSALRRMAHTLVVETPGPGDTGAAHTARHDDIRADLALMGAGEIARFEAHTTAGAERIAYAVAGDDETRLTVQTIDAGERMPPAMSEHTIRRDYDKAGIVFARGEDREFLPGLNLWNFCLMGGCWPRGIGGLVKDEAARLNAAGRWLDDFRPWNFVLSGGAARAIDIGNKAWRKEPEAGGLEKTLRMVAGPVWGDKGT